MKPGVILLFMVCVAGAFFAGWQVGRSHAPVAERPAPAPRLTSEAPPAEVLTTANRPAPAQPAVIEVVKEPPKTAPQPVDPSDPVDLMAAIRKALAAGDMATVGRLSDKLKGWVGDDPAKALQLLAMFDKETNPQILDGVFRFLMDKFLKDPQVRAKVLEIALTHPDPAHQSRALDYLSHVLWKDPAFADTLPQSVVQQIVGMLRNSTSPDVCTAAAHLLRAFTDRPGVLEAMKDVAEDFRSASDGAREAALESLRMSRDPGALDVVFEVMKDDPSDKVRRKAAETLAIMAPQDRKDQVVGQIDSLLSTEKSWDVKGMLVMSLVRVAPDDALPVLQRASAREADPKAKARLDVVTEVLGTGERDPFKILMKTQVGIQRLEAAGK